MTTLLERAGTAFLRMFFVTFIVYVAGILQAPDKNAAISLSIAALAASLAAAFRAVQVFIPQLSFASILPQPVAAWVDSFARAFLAAFITGIAGWLAQPDFSTWKAAGLALVIGAATAGVRAIQGLLTSGESPSPNNGL